AAAIRNRRRCARMGSSQMSGVRIFIGGPVDGLEAGSGPLGWYARVAQGIDELAALVLVELGTDLGECATVLQRDPWRGPVARILLQLQPGPGAGQPYPGAAAARHPGEDEFPFGDAEHLLPVLASRAEVEG